MFPFFTIDFICLFVYNQVRVFVLWFLHLYKLLSLSIFDSLKPISKIWLKVSLQIFLRRLLPHSHKYAHIYLIKSFANYFPLYLPYSSISISI